MILYARKISNIYAAADLADVYVAVFRVTATLADEHPRIERNILLLNFNRLEMRAIRIRMVGRLPSVRDYLAELGDIFSLMHLAEPRIEPEIVFRLAVAPVAGMDERALLESVDWVAHGFEVVQSTGHCQGLPGPGFSFSICA